MFMYNVMLCEVILSNFSFLLTEVGILAPPPAVTQPPAVVSPDDYVEEMTLPPRPTKSPALSTLDFRAPGLFGPDTGLGRWIKWFASDKNVLFSISVLNLVASSGMKHHCTVLSPSLL